MRTIHVLGLDIQATTLKEACQTVCECLPRLKGKYITFVNVHALVMSRDNRDYEEAQKKAVLSFADGQPIAKYQKRHGCEKAKRVAGPDFMTVTFAMTEKTGESHYFYGSDSDTLEMLKKRLLRKYPALRIAGMMSPPPDTDVEKGDFTYDYACINRAKPDYVWIGLGAPKQELWMQKAYGKIDGVMLGVGAGFDFHAGKKKRAPKWMQRMGLEWLHRLLQEPGRLAGRYLKTNVRFLWMCLKEKIWKRTV